MKKGKLIVIEGLDGSGKTKSCKIIQSILKKHQLLNISVREPGSTPIAEKIRKIIKTSDKYEKINKKTVLLLMYAARIQLLKNIIQPALNNGIWVISDRHDLSSLAYQGGGYRINHDIIMMLKKNILNSFMPDMTIYLDVMPNIALKRILSRKKIDKIEKNNLNFFIRVRNSYLYWISKNSNSITINANLNINIVHKDIKNKLEKWLKKNI